MRGVILEYRASRIRALCGRRSGWLLATTGGSFSYFYRFALLWTAILHIGTCLSLFCHGLRAVDFAWETVLLHVWWRWAEPSAKPFHSSFSYFKSFHSSFSYFESNFFVLVIKHDWSRHCYQMGAPKKATSRSPHRTQYVWMYEWTNEPWKMMNFSNKMNVWRSNEPWKMMNFSNIFRYHRRNGRFYRHMFTSRRTM